MARCASLNGDQIGTDVPRHVLPSGANSKPPSQEHWYDPSVFTQRCMQSTVGVWHSLTSDEKDSECESEAGVLYRIFTIVGKCKYTLTVFNSLLLFRLLHNPSSRRKHQTSLLEMSNVLCCSPVVVKRRTPSYGTPFYSVTYLSALSISSLVTISEKFI